MASKPCLLRLQKEYQRLNKEPVPNISAEPRPNNILEWHFVINGPASTPYAGGQYHGKLLFPSDYPYKPPAIMMLTPNGRFNTNTRLCLSMSDFHPESWVPAWSVGTILNGVLSFMLESTPTVGSVEKSTAERQQLARASHAFNRKTALFRELFPDLVAPEEEGGDASGAPADGGGGGEGDEGGGLLSTPALLLAMIAVAAALLGLATTQQLQ
mmetsp:Transcript_15084/g.45772  ORF Transcript_15084/g.45772 Transcript_15084/m.45772 type:complete len:213 (+) Transcript_15084:78-716(+)